jgi:putative PIN family toxin of toxin-antitoxin system
MLRVTPDVNTLVEAAISPAGPSSEILRVWEAGEVVLVLCEEILAEFQDVLSRPRIQMRYSRITADTITQQTLALRRNSAMITVSEVPPIVTLDPDDDVILACAIAGQAAYVVSRDGHLLAYAGRFPIPIMRPEDFLSMLRRRSQP